MSRDRQDEVSRRAALRQGTTLRTLVGERRKHEAEQGQRSERGGVDLEPGCAYGVVTRQMVTDLFEELRAIRARMDSLFTVIMGAIALDLLLRLAGLK